MAINYPSFVVPRGYEPKDPFEQFAKGYGLTKGLKDESDAANLLTRYADTLYGAPTSQAATRPVTPAAYADQLVGGSHAAAADAADPMLTAYLANTRRAESGGNDSAKNPTSSATGRYQFLEGTWNDLMQRHPDLGLTPDGRTDPNQQEKAIRVFTAENARALKGSGVSVTPGALYAAHFLGAGGAPKVLMGDPNSPVSAYVDPAVMQANPHLADMTVADFKAWTDKQGGNASGGYQAPTLAQPSTAPAGGGLPPRELMAQLLANPVTRPLAIDLAKGVQTGAVKPTDDIQEYMFAVQQGFGGDFAAWQNTKKSDTNVTVNNGGSSDFYKKLDTDAGEQQAVLLDAGRNARSNNIRLGALEQHLSDPSNQGASGAIKQFAGSLGIPVEGLDDLQAAQALINQMVPGQRPPGSGTMSDADLALFKQSLPAIINQPGGNQRIIQTTKAINDYTIALSEIAERVASREIDPAEGRRLQAAVPNPLANLAAPTSAAPSEAPPANWSGDPSLWQFLTPEERALWN